jgi:hypothetical protein
MSEGRLAPVRETDRHASLVAGCAAAVCAGATFAALYGAGIRPSLGGGAENFTTSFPFLVGVSAAIGLAMGCIEGAVASRAARRAADRFADLSIFGRKVFFASAIANVACGSVAAIAAFGGSDRVAALAITAMVAVAASAVGAALFAWSHAVDWPHVPEYMRANLSNASAHKPQPRSIEREHEHEPTVDLRAEPDLTDVVKEGRTRRSSSKPSDDDLWDEIQDLIKGK